MIRVKGAFMGRLYAGIWRLDTYLRMAQKGNEAIIAQDPRLRRNPFLRPCRLANRWAAHRSKPSAKGAKEQADTRLTLFRKLRMLE